MFNFYIYLKFYIVGFVIFSFRMRIVRAQCPLCGFRAAYWLRNELAELNCGSCESLSGSEKIFGDVDLLFNKSSAMLKNGKLNLHGAVGDTGTFGAPGPMGYTGSRGLTGMFGLSGRTGYTGPTGATGPQGVKGLPGRFRFKRQANSASEETVRKKITPFLSNCSEVNGYFLTFADQVDDKRSNKAKPNSTGKVESQSMKNLITRYEQVSRLYEHVQTLFQDARKEIEADPRYKGATGSTGFPGPMGFVGYTGLFGPTGATGITGPPGQPGVLGQPGLPGLPGAVGPTGNTGPSNGT